jgi:pyruvate/2-oxoglutarate dehydrogenase complex dihydrolipoamide dehydrogenase (E3) component
MWPKLWLPFCGKMESRSCWKPKPSASPKRDASVRLAVNTPGGERVLTGSHLLVAPGRVPNVESLNLAAAGVAIDSKGFIRVNELLETNIPGIYAMGDVKGGPAFTHISYDDFRILKTNLIDGGNTSILGRLVPYIVFTDPQLGRVGLTETEARAQGLNVRVAKMPMTYLARALEVDESRGFMKVIIDAASGRIVGCAILGIEGGIDGPDRHDGQPDRYPAA